MATPTRVFEGLLAGIGSGDWSGLHLFYAEDADVAIPFARPAPVRLVGREQVRAHFAAMAGRMALSPRDVRVHETADPEVIVAEWDYEAGGVRFANVQVLRVRGGVIVESRDYHDHAAIAEIIAGLSKAA